MRVFAIPGSGVQQILKPIHDSIFGLLKTLPCDYTHDQNRFRYDLIRGKWKGREAYSYDLSSATDRFPLEIQH